MHKGDTQELPAINLDPPKRPTVMRLFDSRGDWRMFINTSSSKINADTLQKFVCYCAYLESQRVKTK